MKRLLIFTSCLFFLSLNLNANHFIGGDISWTCLSSGQFVFELTLYRDCSGVNSNFGNKTLEIIGNPLPRNTAGQVINQITLYPDNSWLNNNFQGHLNTRCNGTNGNLNCINGDRGSYQIIKYKSNAIKLTGNPLNGFWEFRYVEPCCRPNTDNLNTIGSIVIRANMYSSAISPNGCLDSSPKFAHNPDFIGCSGIDYYSSQAVYDLDLDSIEYLFANPLFQNSAGHSSSVPYKNGFSYLNPLPDGQFDARNIPLQLNPKNGKVKARTFVSGGIRTYWLSYQVNSFRDGNIMATVYREFPLSIFNCPLLSNQSRNRHVNILLNGDTLKNDTNIQVVVGDTVQFNLKGLDLDLVGSNFQTVTLSASSELFATDFLHYTVCKTNGIAPCATLTNNNLSLNSSAFPVQLELSGLRQVSTTFNWITLCNHLFNLDRKTYYFTFKIQDDHCPIPLVNYQVIGVEIIDNPNNPCGTITSIIDEESLNERISIFPNPTNGLVNVKLAKKEQLEVNIRNMQGKLLQSKRLKDKEVYRLEIDVPAGIYFLEISTSDGQKVMKKIVKQ